MKARETQAIQEQTDGEHFESERGTERWATCTSKTLFGGSTHVMIAEWRRRRAFNGITRGGISCRTAAAALLRSCQLKPWAFIDGGGSVSPLLVETASLPSLSSLARNSLLSICWAEDAGPKPTLPGARRL